MIHCTSVQALSNRKGPLSVLESIFFPFQKGPDVQKSKQEVTTITFLVKDGRKFIMPLSDLYPAV